MDNLKTLYNNSIEDILSSVSLSNKMQVPKLVKVSINMGLGKMSDAGKGKFQGKPSGTFSYSNKGANIGWRKIKGKNRSCKLRYF